MIRWAALSLPWTNKVQRVASIGADRHPENNVAALNK